MIKKLLIRNFALIEELEIAFDRGLNILTGETGSGKSIIISAIDIVLGARASKDGIKTGTDRAYIELCAEINGEETVISREIAPSSAKSRINGVLVTLNEIQALRKTMLDIHSQHESYRYMQPATHIELLDNYAGKDCLKKYRELFNQYNRVKSEYESLKAASTESERQADFLKFQINEIKEAKISDINEYNSLAAERELLVNTEELKELAFSGYDALYGGEQNITDALYSVQSRLKKAVEYDNKLNETLNIIASSVINLKEAATELRNYSENLETDPQKLALIEERMELLQRLKRKYGPELDHILQNLETFESELSRITSCEEKIVQLEQETVELRQKTHELALKLSSIRAKTAERLSELIQNELIKLEMPKARFFIDIKTENQLSANGYDIVEFLISPNRGEPLKPLAKIASGGEVSRIMLALKTIFARSDRVNTVIFDEIDTGISGKTSQAVADAFCELAESHQIICITHQPIIAAAANRHIHVQKSQDKDTTRVLGNILDRNSRVAAIAELAGGSKSDADSINFAQKLLKQTNKETIKT